jgi:hypothetical protein
MSPKFFEKKTALPSLPLLHIAGARYAFRFEMARAYSERLALVNANATSPGLGTRGECTDQRTHEKSHNAKQENQNRGVYDRILRFREKSFEELLHGGPQSIGTTMKLANFPGARTFLMKLSACSFFSKYTGEPSLV